MIQEGQQVQINQEELEQFFIYLPPSDQFFLSFNYWIENDSENPLVSSSIRSEDYKDSISQERIKIMSVQISPAQAS